MDDKELDKITNNAVWRTKKGEKIPVPKLGDQHLTNCYRMIVRNILSSDQAYSMIYSPVWGPNPDSMAFYYAEQEAEDYETYRKPKLEAWKAILAHELKRRDLPIPVVTIDPMPEAESIEYTETGRIIKLKQKGEKK